MSVWTYNPDLDEGLAVSDALAAYLTGLPYGPGGDCIHAVFPAYAEPEDNQDPPAIFVGEASGAFDAHALSAVALEETEGGDLTDRRVLYRWAEWTGELEVEIICTDPEQRSRVMLALREALVAAGPDDERPAIVLDVPRYYGGAAKAVVTPLRSRVEDGADAAGARVRMGYLTVAVKMAALTVARASALYPRGIVALEG